METLQYNVQMQCTKTQVSVCENHEVFQETTQSVKMCLSKGKAKIVIKAVIYFDSIDLKSALPLGVNFWYLSPVLPQNTCVCIHT